jgi:hypothetical protein
MFHQNLVVALSHERRLLIGVEQCNGNADEQRNSRRIERCAAAALAAHGYPGFRIREPLLGERLLKSFFPPCKLQSIDLFDRNQILSPPGWPVM